MAALAEQVFATALQEGDDRAWKVDSLQSDHRAASRGTRSRFTSCLTSWAPASDFTGRDNVNINSFYFILPSGLPSYYHRV